MAPLVAPRVRADRAFERIYRRHVGDVYRYALAVLRNPSDAEDVTQTTFLNAYRAFQRGERPRKPENWLIRIAHNVCRQRFRQTSRRPNEVAFDEELAESMPREPDATSARDLTNALGRLAFNQRSALVMRELEGRSYVEIAETLGLTIAAVETLLFRARRALREQLEGGLTCREAELAISRQLDDRLPRSDRGALRAHLRECSDCATFARSQRAQRSAWKGLAAIPLPSSLGSFFGGGSAALGAGAATAGFGVAAKATALVAAAAVAGGVGYEGVKQSPWRKKKTEPIAQRVPAPAPPFAASAPPTAVSALTAGRTIRVAARTKAVVELKAKRAKAVRKQKLKRLPGRARKAAVSAAAAPVARRAHAVVRSERRARPSTPNQRAAGLARHQRTKVKAKSKAPPNPKAKVEKDAAGKADRRAEEKPEAKEKKPAEQAIPAAEEHGNAGNGGGGKK